MSSFFYEIVADAITYDNKEQMAELYDLKLLDMRSWCSEQMEDVGVPPLFIAYTLDDLFAGDSDFGYKLWEYIQLRCAPEEEEITSSLQHTAHASAPLPLPLSVAP